MSMQLLSDNELVKLYMDGNEESLSILVKRHKRRIFSYVYLITRDKTLTEDVFQETFFKVIQTLKKQQYNEEGKFLPWVLRIAKNLIIDHFRKVKKMPSVSSVMNDEGEITCIFDIIPEVVSSSKDSEQSRLFKETIRSIVSGLPQDQKEVVIMRTYYDMSFKEIAEVTNVSINTSLGRMRYALINLKKMLEEKNVEIYI
ncbi:MAG: polymerase sigma-70 factor, subfamily [Bacteroidota bacterium]|jgi:RNA polymerase sigma-70 factor (ECF subfamily)|nr:polymerase sigma-70 factor, subfamily [Bacteroidota bacterium]